MKCNPILKEESAGCTVVSEPISVLDPKQLLKSIQEAYRAGSPVERVMRAQMAALRAERNPGVGDVGFLPTMEYGRSHYRKRKCGKVASFFRCLLR